MTAFVQALLQNYKKYGDKELECAWDSMKFCDNHCCNEQNINNSGLSNSRLKSLLQYFKRLARIDH
jgi:hypothetical protein